MKKRIFDFIIKLLEKHGEVPMPKREPNYSGTSEGGIPWDDPIIAIDWPKLDREYKTSEKDGKHACFIDQSFEWAEKWLK